jgi:hypothetical protein
MYLGASGSSQLNISGYNAYGGTGYHGFLGVTNTYGSATNPNKYFRLTSAGAIEIVNSAYNAILFTLDNSGNFTAAANITAYSDERVKTNWRGYSSDFVEQLAKIKHGTYDRTDQELTQDGVSAQSLQALLPSSVLTQENGDLAVAYGNAAMVSAVQLAQRVVEQDARIARLEALVAKLTEGK